MLTWTDIKYCFRHIWWFVSGLGRNTRQWFLEAIGNIRIYDRPLWFVFNPSNFKIHALQIRKALELLEPGDVVVRKYDTFVLGAFIPGRFSHSGVYIGMRSVAGIQSDIVVHALAKGVQMTDAIDFFMCCDGFAILRPKCDNQTKKQACTIAEGYIGATYDYRFDICEDYKNKDEVTARTKSVYCHELTRSCFPTLDIPTIAPQLWNGMIRSEKRQFLAQSFFDSQDFEVVYDSFYSEVH